MIEKRSFQLFWKIFRTTFYISTFTFGGGYVIVPLLQKKFSDDLQWIPKEEVLNLTALAQAAPGALAVNASIMLGHHVAGIAGGLVAVLGTVLPPLIILSVISANYAAFRANRFIAAVLSSMAACVAALVVNVVLGTLEDLIKSRKLWKILIFATVLAARFLFQVSIIYLIIGCGILGVLLRGIGRKAGKALL